MPKKASERNNFEGVFKIAWTAQKSCLGGEVHGQTDGQTHTTEWHAARCYSKPSAARMTARLRHWQALLFLWVQVSQASGLFPVEQNPNPPCARIRCQMPSTLSYHFISINAQRPIVPKLNPPSLFPTNASVEIWIWVTWKFAQRLHKTSSEWSKLQPPHLRWGNVLVVCLMFFHWEGEGTFPVSNFSNRQTCSFPGESASFKSVCKLRLQGEKRETF